MEIGGWRMRSVFERYAIVSGTDFAIRKLQFSEAQTQIGREMSYVAQSGENEAQDRVSKNLLDCID